MSPTQIGIRLVVMTFVGATMATPVLADNILVLKDFSGDYFTVNGLTQLGHNVTAITGTLSDYSGYDQVWDMRAFDNMTASDQSAMGSYLDSGGRMFLVGEHVGFDAIRNITLDAWITAVGGGSMGSRLWENRGFTQDFTPMGQALLNQPNTLPNIIYQASSSFDPGEVGNGFAVTVAQDNGRTSMVGWDFGDITGAPDARMLICWDSTVFRPGQNPEFLRNAHHYLSVPEPGILVVMAIGTLTLVGRRKRRVARA